MIKYTVFLCTFTCIILGVDGCKSAEKSAQGAESEGRINMEELAQAKYGPGYEIQWNSSETFALVSKQLKTRPNDAYPTLRFLIYDAARSEIVYENTEPGGKAIWESNDVVLISTSIAIPNPNADKQSKAYRFNVKTRKKYSGKFLKQK